MDTTENSTQQETPSSIAAPTHEQVKRETLAEIVKKAREADARITQQEIDNLYSRCWENLDNYSPEMMRHIATVPTVIAVDFFEVLARHSKSDDYPTYVSDWVTVSAAFLELSLPADITTMVRGFPYCKGIAPLSDLERRQKQVIAICRTIWHMRMNRLGGTKTGRTSYIDGGVAFYYIEDETLVSLFATHDDPGAVADLIIARNLIDGEQLTELIDAMSDASGALVEGTL